MVKTDDREYEEHVLTVVTRETDGWVISQGSFSFYCPDRGVEPHVGDVARFYGQGFGRPVRGLDLNGVEVFYRTPEEDAAEHRRQVEQWQEDKRQAFAAKRADLDADYAALPAEFQRRLDGFRRRRADWRWQHEAYEMSVCRDAVKIARALGSTDAVRHFHGLKTWAEQTALVPNLFDGHSGNSFGQACYLAMLWMDHPELVERAHGALCPLTGCQDYGCAAAEQAIPP